MKTVEEILTEGIEPARLAVSLQGLSSAMALKDGRDEALASWAQEWGAALIADISHRVVAVGRLLAIRIFLQQGLQSAMLMVQALEAVAKLPKAKIRRGIVDVMQKHGAVMVFNSWLSEGAALFDNTAEIQEHAVNRSMEDRQVGESEHVN